MLFKAFNIKTHRNFEAHQHFLNGSVGVRIEKLLVGAVLFVCEFGFNAS